ncbi:MAG TPA: ATP phosphoribosyltransferase regulatory subunit, partial [Patescibacteria group bacterium]|nr:ATP phosphoribosyltransferase regulatory subunit [Patescibacteria group bacterium]
MSYLSTQPVKGFRDFYPDEMAIRNWLFGKMRTISRLYGYQEYDGPVVESVHLYEAKSGEELVKDQTFQMQDKGGRQLALRPEMTPSLARMVAAKQQQLTKPVRWFTIGPRFRYEAPQKGRAREFYQWDIDCLGYSSPLSDAEIIAIACHFFEEIGLTHQEIVIKINNRKLMDFKLSLLEIPLSKRPGVFRLIDKRDKMTHDKWRQYARHVGLSDKQLSALSKLLTDRDVAFESEELTEVFSTLKDLGFSRFVEYDPSVVRGLEYYTGTVFEARDRAGKFRAI